MGTVALKLGSDGSIRAKKEGSLSTILKFVLAFAIVCTNLLTLYTMSMSGQAQTTNIFKLGALGRTNEARLTEEISGIREDILVTRQQLLQLRKSLLHAGGNSTASPAPAISPMDGALRQKRTSELFYSIAPHKLPLGKHPLLGTSELESAVGHACGAGNLELLQLYMKYKPGAPCPDDWHVAQRLIVRGCEPLPRRRCFARAASVPKFLQPSPFPISLWKPPSDRLIRWTHYTCKSLQCLNQRKFNKTFADCIDCFDLEGVEKLRWVTARDRHDFLIDEVLALKKGSIRVGLDIGGGSGSFAARMAERNVTIVTTTLNFNGPFSEFISLRGLVPLYLSIGQRFPFFDNTMDLVHSMHVLSNWIPTQTLEFLLYDIDRILRPGGLFWLDRFFSTQEQLKSVYAPLIGSLGYKKLKWVTGLKLDKDGKEKHHIYLSALLEKPLTR